MKKKSAKKKRLALSNERIAGLALALIDAKGLDGFSFRGLARKLGCEAMSIYHYFPSKAHLFDAVLAIYLGEMSALPDDAPWLDRLRNVCTEFRAAALRHPGFYPYFSVHRLNTHAGLKFLNGVLRAFESSGLPAELRARHFRAVGYYLMGAGLDETMGYANGPSAAEPVSDAVVAREFPAVAAVGPYFKPAYHAATFEHGLETLLRKIAEDAAAARR